MTIRLVIISISIMLYGCSNNIQDIKLLYKESVDYDFGLDIETNYYLKGQLEFKLLAEEMKKFREAGENIFPKGIKVIVYNQNSDTTAIMSSEFAIQKKNEQLVEAFNNVILRNSKNEQLNTEKLFWDGNSKTIYTDDFVTIKTENKIIMGYGFVTDESFSSYSLSDITGTIYL